MNGEKSSFWANLRQLLPGVLISGIALWFLVRTVSWHSVASALKSMSLLSLGLAILIYLISMVARAICWETLLQRQFPLKRAFFVLNEGYMFNNLFPFRLGEIARAVLLGGNSKVGILPVFSTIIVERSYDLCIACTLLLSTLPFVLGMRSSQIIAIVLLAVVILGLVALYFMVRYKTKVTEWLGGLPIKWNFYKNSLVPAVGSILDGFSVLTKPSFFIMSLIFMIISWGLAIIEDYILLRNVVPASQLWWVAFILSASALGAGLPSIPGAIGVYEAAAVGALALLGVGREPALAYALVVHAIQFVFSTSIGAVGLTLEGKNISDIYRKIKNRKISPPVCES